MLTLEKFEEAYNTVQKVVNQTKLIYSDFFSATAQKCQMKAAVLELVRTIGTPNVELPQILE